MLGRLATKERMLSMRTLPRSQPSRPMAALLSRLARSQKMVPQLNCWGRFLEGDC